MSAGYYFDDKRMKRLECADYESFGDGVLGFKKSVVSE